MSSTEPQRLDSLTPKHWERLPNYHEEWIKRSSTSPRPADEEYENFLGLIYSVQKHGEPKVFWCDSPWQLMAVPILVEILARTRLKFREEIGPCLKSPLWDKAWKQMSQQLDEATLENLRTSISEHSFAGNCSGVGNFMNPKFSPDIESAVKALFPIEINDAVLPHIRAHLRKTTTFNRDNSAPAIQVLQAVMADTTLGSRVSQVADIPGPITALHGGVVGLMQSVGNIFSPNTFRSVAPVETSLDQVFEALGQLSFSTKEIFRRASENFQVGGMEHEFQSQLGPDLAGEIWRAIHDMPDTTVSQMLQLFMAMRLMTWGPAVLFQVGGDNFMPTYSFLLDTTDEQLPDYPIVKLVNEWTRFAGHCFPTLMFGNMAFVARAPVQMHVDDRGRLHSDQAPAIVYRDGFQCYSWHGTTVPEFVIKDPQSITINKIENESNAETRRVMIERYGVSTYLRDTQAKIVSVDEYGVLYRKSIPGDEPIVMVELKNSTAEPDGSYKTYFLRVPPNTRTAKEAVAWTFGVEAQDYAPERET